MELHEDILFLAFRYAITRSTYVVSEVVDVLMRKWDLLSERNKSLIIKEIQQAIDRNEIHSEIDKNEWKKILELNEK